MVGGPVLADGIHTISSPALTPAAAPVTDRGPAMPGRDIIVIGASAGGVEALTNLARQLPPDLPAAVFIVLHVPSHGTSVLPKIISRAGPLPATHAWDGETIRPGRIYVAP